MELVNAQRPDVVAIVGDLVDGDVAQLREDVAPLADLVSEQGVFFVTGNHEYFVDTGAWLRHLPTLGVQVLRNAWSHTASAPARSTRSPSWSSATRTSWS